MAGAAAAQGAANVATARANARANNPNIYGPYGTQTVTWGEVSGQPDQPTIRQQFTPEQQRIFDINQQGQLGLAQVGTDAINRVGGILGQDVNFDRDLGTQAQGRQEVIDAMMSRFDTDLSRRRGGVESDLIARGIPRGSEAWNREMDTLERARTDALQQSIVGADARAMDERRQSITEMLAQRQTPLNEISALRSGSQIAPLQFQPYQGSNAAPAPVFQGAVAQGQANQNAYNANVANRNSMMSGLFGLGAAGIGTYPW